MKSNRSPLLILLISGPDKVEENLPDYPGFERDVFKVVKDYFEGLDEPLLTFSMYEVFTNVFGKLERSLCLHIDSYNVYISNFPVQCFIKYLVANP